MCLMVMSSYCSSSFTDFQSPLTGDFEAAQRTVFKDKQKACKLIGEAESCKWEICRTFEPIQLCHEVSSS